MVANIIHRKKCHDQ